jgi:hypothetical protein
MKLQKSQTVFLIIYFLIRTLLEFFISFFLILTIFEHNELLLFVLLPVVSLGIIGHNFRLNILQKNKKQVKFTYLFNIGYAIIIAAIGKIYFSGGGFCIDSSPVFFAVGGGVCLLEILKYVVIEKGSKNIEKD